MTGLRDDGYRWVQGLISNPKSWTLLDPDGHRVAHAYPCNDRTWSAVWDDGGLISDSHPGSGPALRAVDDLARPCAFVDADTSHGIVPCDNERVPGSSFCASHKVRDERAEAVAR